MHGPAGTDGKGHVSSGHGGVGTDQQNFGHGGVGTDQENVGHGGVGPRGPTGPTGGQGKLMLMHGAAQGVAGHDPGSSQVRAANTRNEFMAQTSIEGNPGRG